MTLLPRTLIAACLAGLGLAAPMQADERNLSVTVTYLERIALPPDAELSVSLLDTSLMDVAAVQLSQQRFRMDKVPFEVSLSYDPDLIDDRHTYTVAAQITSRREVIFRTTTAYPVLTRDAPSEIEIVLQKMSHGADAATPGDGVVGLAWQVVEIGGQVKDVDDPPTMTIDAEGGLGLYGGCNRFRGKVTVANGAFSLSGPLAGTRMACPPDRMKLDDDMIRALEASTGYARTGEFLVLTDDAGDATLRFREQRG
ncbi:YbaY family lipoprotein [Tropicimonas sp. S265A]|uniref:YbaY family lipoprotein n=1 Tax=Tropicimonas sp. S265A TaxID=3415134 RepID=UPI003C7C306A